MLKIKSSNKSQKVASNHDQCAKKCKQETQLFHKIRLADLIVILFFHLCKKIGSTVQPEQKRSFVTVGT